ncbi:MAG: endonuclease/exonuclease/phosphatase family protein [Opitutaceae bacterium]|jgi:endonuclease/exonuclease/phosphatase family metal-dependent hydrolase|nr:endonuclease/exonuclease/phosphatase family protein [Opitutaceae bacterium]
MKTIRHLLPLFILHFLLCAGSAAAADSVTVRTRKSGTAIRVVTVNIRVPSPKDYNTGNGWDQRRELCRDVLLAQDADIFCFQECRHTQLGFVKEKMPGFEHFAVDNSIKEGAPPEPTIAILYSTGRFKKVRAGGFWLSGTPAVPGSRFEGSTYPRLSNWVLLQDRKTGREIIVWNTHLHHLGGAAGDAVREKQIAVLLEHAGKIPGEVPQILAGDFNTSGQSGTVKAVKAAGWTDTYPAIHGPANPGPTFHGFVGEKTKGKNRIDFIFASSRLRATAAEIIRDSRDGRYPSDHYFVSAELEYETAPQTKDTPSK